MDRRRPRVRYAFAALALAVGLTACQNDSQAGDRVTVEVAALDWLDLAADPVEHLTTQPATCLSEPNDPAVQRGALLFASPVLLGGQAAKAGLSCAACHRNGRGNPNFVFTGISGPPGSADVTHGLFSSVRADRIFNPVVIPDLATEAGHVKVNRQHVGELEAFLTAQIIEEFSGTAPEPQAIADLAAYIRALDDRTCSGGANELQSWRTEFNHLRAGLTSQGSMSDTYIGAMRAALGRLHNRFPGDNSAQLRADLIRFSRALAADTDISVLQEKLQTLATDLDAAADQSLYNPNILESALR